MTKILLMKDADASEIYGSYTGLVYLTPLLGGYLCDKFLGNRRSIIIGGLLMAIGQFFMFFSASAGADGGVTLMWMGLTSIIIGNGFFKPNISSKCCSTYRNNFSIDNLYLEKKIINHFHLNGGGGGYAVGGFLQSLKSTA